eukprot:TRINITY_DN1954_c0_g1_i3.p1 TRINITY_DN1954_c0_g1~~TRINITY_DN1954_c0_g1_i3.p1  ORF type:complete len:1100 (-),score=395.71 TRINITY_DN1954_c0_g1_i3:28-3327(-)
MEGIVVKFLSKYFNLFIKNFVKENFNLSLFKGEGKLTNLVLNEKVLQELLMIPPTMEVKSATCNDLTVNVNWTKLKHEPLVITLDKIEVELSEPLNVSAMPNLMSQFQGKSKKKTSQLEILLDVTVKINSISLKVSTLPSLKPNWTPLLEITIKNVVLQSTNGSWQVVDLAKAKDTDPTNKDVQLLHKELNARAISVVLHTENNGRIVLLDEAPLKVRMTSKWNLKEALWLGGSVETIVNQLVLNTTVSEWESLIEFARCLKVCAARPVPERAIIEGTPSVPRPDNAELPMTGYDISYILSVRKWALEVLETDKVDPKKTQVFDFEGNEGLRVTFTNSKKLNTKEKLKYFTYETSVAFVLPTVSLKRSLPTLNSTSVLLSRTDRETKQVSDLVAMKTSWKLAPNLEHGSSHELKLEELHYGLKLDSAQVLLDRHLWYELYSLFERNLKRKEQTEEVFLKDEDKEKMKEKVKSKLQEKLSMVMDWNDISAAFEATNLKVLIPELSTNVMIDKMSFINQPKWQVIPLLAQKPRFVRPAEETKHIQPKKSLPPPPPPKPGQAPPLPPKDGAAPPLPPKPTEEAKLAPPLPPKVDVSVVKAAVTERIKSNVAYKLEADISGISIEVATSPLDTEVIYQSDKLRLYGSYSQSEPENPEAEIVTEVEFALHSGQVSVKVTDAQFSQFYTLFKSYQESFHNYMKTSDRFKGLRAKLEDKIKAKVEEGKEKLQNEQIPDVDSLKAKVKHALEMRKVAFLWKADKGTFDLPLRSLLSLQNLESPKLRNSAGKAKRIVPLRFENFELGFENSADRQNFMLRLKSMQINELDIKHVDHLFTFEPLATSEESIYKQFALSTDENFNMRLYYSRQPPSKEAQQKGYGSSSDVWLRLEDMRIVLKRKNEEDLQRQKLASQKQKEKKKAESGIEETPQNGINAVQTAIQKVVAMIDSRKGDVMSKLDIVKGKEDLIKDNLHKLKFDLRWGVEMGDCTIIYGEREDSTNEKPSGVFKFSNGALIKQIEKRFSDLEGQLISSKTELAGMMAEVESERNFADQNTRDLEAKLAQALKDRELFENRYIEAKMALSEVQMQNADMQRNMFNMERKQQTK